MTFLPKEPYRMPGYTGYIPGQREHISITRSELSKSSHVHSDYPEQIKNFQSRQIKDRCESKRLVNETLGIPGWTGYVPQKPFSHGSESFATSQAKCLREFSASRDQRVRDTQIILDKTARHPRMNALDDHKTKPQTAPSPDMNCQGLVSTSSLGPRWRKSGYTGYVPGQQSGNIHGLTFQRKNDQCVRVFHNDQATLKRSASNTINPVSVTNSRATIYQRTGVIPKYQGYVPGRAFRFGESLSRDATRVKVPSQFTTVTI
jgi:hypothetical protein